MTPTAEREPVQTIKIRYGFSEKAESAGMRAKIHFLDDNNQAKCNSKMAVLDTCIYDGSLADLSLELKMGWVCKSCLKNVLMNGERNLCP